MSAAAKVKLLPLELEVVSGPHLGQKFSFVDTVSITIGRGAENQVCLQHDPRVSRVHVEIKQENEIIFINNMTEKNTMLVNGRKETHFKVLQSCTFSLGETEIRFTFPNSKPFKNPLQPLSPSPVPVGLVQPRSNQPAPQQPKAPGPVIKNQVPANPIPPIYNTPIQSMGMPRSAAPQQPPRRRKVPKKSEGFNPILLIVVVAAILVVVFVLPSKNEDTDSKPDKAPSLVTPVYQEEIRYQESMEKAKKALAQMENRNSRQAMAQQFFISGMREFLNGNYHRSVGFLNSAYQSDPTLVEAEKFAREAQRKLDRLIDFYFSEGLKYRENNNFRMCKSSFQAVQLYILNNMKHPRYLEAKQFYDECSSLDKARRF